MWEEEESTKHSRDSLRRFRKEIGRRLRQLVWICGILILRLLGNGAPMRP